MTGTIECEQGSFLHLSVAAYKLVVFVFCLTLRSLYEKEAPTTLIDRLVVDL